MLRTKKHDSQVGNRCGGVDVWRAVYMYLCMYQGCQGGWAWPTDKIMLCTEYIQQKWDPIDHHVVCLHLFQNQTNQAIGRNERAQTLEFRSGGKIRKARSSKTKGKPRTTNDRLRQILPTPTLTTSYLATMSNPQSVACFGKKRTATAVAIAKVRWDPWGGFCGRAARRRRKEIYADLSTLGI